MFNGVYKLSTFGKELYRPIGAEPTDVGDAVKMTINETTMRVCLNAGRAMRPTGPQNLGEWAGRRKVDPATVQGSVRVDDGTVILPQP